MNVEAYRAIKMQIEEEKQEIELEISKLQVKRMNNMKMKEVELKKLSHAKKMFERNKTIMAGALHHTYRFEIVEKADKEIEIINEFILMQNVELEKIKEKEKEVDLIFKRKLINEKKQEEQKEEKLTLEYKKLLSRFKKY